MKNLRVLYVMPVLCFCFLITGCEDYLDREPLAELSPATFFTSKGDMKIWVAGMYDEFQNALNGDQAAHLEWGDLRSDNYGTTGYGDTRVYMNAIDASQAQYNWENLYRVIDRCNTAIARFPEIPNLLPADYNDFLGQCHGMRALMYFYAIRVWGGVPVITEPWNGELATSRIERSSVDTVKELIYQDLQNAIDMLSVEVTGSRKYYFNLGAAWALKTDVHMWFKEYDQAIAASEYFTNNANYALVANSEQWKNMFTDPAGSSVKETIFNIHWASDLTDGNNAWAQRVGASNTNNPYQVSRIIFNEFIDRLYSGQGRDGRFWNSLDTVKLWAAGNKVPLSYNHYGASGTQKCIKYSAPSTADPLTERWQVLSTATSFVQVPIYRLADVLTLRAEALNQLGQSNEALDIVNRIRNRVGYTADAKTEADMSDKKAVEWIILQERQLEFMCEGKRWFDLRRTDRVIEVMDPVMRQRQQDYNVTISGFGDPGRVLFPIYYKEFEANPALNGHQNPPYTQG